MNYLITFLGAFLISVFLTGFLRRIGLKYKLVSIPRERDIHKRPVPRIGGLAIFCSFLLVTIVYAAFVHGLNRHITGIWCASVLIVLAMLFDDVYGLKAWQKLLFQITAVLVVIASGIGINSIPVPLTDITLNLNSIYIPIFTMHGITYHFSLWSDLLTLVWIVGMMNIINFVDGVDGLAGGVSSIAALTIFFLSVNLFQSNTALLSIVLSGATLGFLIWNFPPAKIFMGDTGSMFLGFMLGVLTLISGGKLATVFLVLGFPIIDGLLVVGGRLKRGENPFTTPDKTHLHHRFLKAGFTPRQAIISMYLISIAFAWVALRSTTKNKMIASIILIFLVFVLTRILNIKIRKSKAV